MTAIWEMRLSVRPEFTAAQLVPPFVVIKTPLLSLPAKNCIPFPAIEVMRFFMVNIYCYLDFIEFLQADYKRRKHKNSRYSYRVSSIVLPGLF